MIFKMNFPAVGATLFCAMLPFAFGGESDYQFVKNFKLVSAVVERGVAKITLGHASVPLPPEFRVVPAGYCQESFPPKCRATIVKLDDQISYDDKTSTTLEVNLSSLFPYSSPVLVELVGPNKTVQISY